MVTIRAETAADRSAIHEVNILAFGREDEACLVDAVRTSPEFLPELSLVAVEGMRIVGHVLFSSIRIRTVSDRVPALALAPVAVLPEHQNRGIGSALIRHGLAESARLGHRIVVVVGHATYYPRFGFGSARAAGLEAPFPDASFMALELSPGALAGISGEVEYPPAFGVG